MQRKSQLYLSLILTTVILFSLALVFYLIPSFPINGNKDFLDILSSLGDAFGIVALISLIFTIFWRKSDERKSNAPNLEISKPLVRDENESSFNIDRENLNSYFFFEKLDNDIPKDYSDKCKIYWDKLYKTKENSAELVKFLEIKIKNDHSNSASAIVSLTFNMKVIHICSSDTRRKQSYEFWLPSRKMSIGPGKEITMYIKIGPIGNESYDRVEGLILGYECWNRDGHRYNSRELGFQTISFDAHLLPIE